MTTINTYKLLDRLELKGEDYTDSQEGHWCLYSFGTARPFDAYPNETFPDDVYKRFTKKYRLPEGWLEHLTNEGLLDSYCVDDGTLHLNFTSKCRLGGVTE